MSVCLKPTHNWKASLFTWCLVSHSHHLDKRKCNTATCVTQRLADFLIRSSNTIGTVYAPTNVGASTYGKRDMQPLNYRPL